MAFKANSIGVYRGENCCTKTLFFIHLFGNQKNHKQTSTKKKNSIQNYLSQTHLPIIQYNWYHFLK